MIKILYSPAIPLVYKLVILVTTSHMLPSCPLRSLMIATEFEIVKSKCLSSGRPFLFPRKIFSPIVVPGLKSVYIGFFDHFIAGITAAMIVITRTGNISGAGGGWWCVNVSSCSSHWTFDFFSEWKDMWYSCSQSKTRWH